MPILQLRLFGLDPVPGGRKRSTNPRRGFDPHRRSPHDPVRAVERVRAYRPRGEATHAVDKKYVRYVGRGWYQARVWLGPRGALLDCINLGLYRTEYEASKVAKQWIRDGHDPLVLPPRVLPKWVKRRGAEYIATAKIERPDRGVPPGRVILGPFPDPVSAHRAMLAVLTPAPRVPDPPRGR